MKDVVDGFVWVTEGGRGYSYIAVPFDNMTPEMKKDPNWRRWDLVDLPSAIINNSIHQQLEHSVSKFGAYAIAKCSNVGLSHDLQGLFGPSVNAAYDGYPCIVGLPTINGKLDLVSHKEVPDEDEGDWDFDMADFDLHDEDTAATAAEGGDDFGDDEAAYVKPRKPGSKGP